jgi:hypothetical protein
MRADRDAFGRAIVEVLRDPAIADGVFLFKPSTVGPTARRWRRVAESGDFEAFVSTVVPDIVDSVIFQLLHAIDDELFELTVTTDDDEKVTLPKEAIGEAAGWYLMDDEGWRHRFSKCSVDGEAPESDP